MEVVCVAIAGGDSVGSAGTSDVDAGNVEVAAFIVTTTIAVSTGSGVLAALGAVVIAVGIFTAF
jgi:hypothetical protein